MLLELSLVTILKQQFNKLGKMGQVKEINIKNQTYFFDDMINTKNFHSNLLKIDKK